jgi:26S proteasome regulatory subunit N10
MLDSFPQAIVFLIDNSATSLDGDFYPNRLEAQKQAVTRLSQWFLHQCKRTQVGVGTMGGNACRIASCLTSDTTRFLTAIDRISRGGECLLDQAIRCAILSLKMRTNDIKIQRIIALISSPTRLTNEGIADLSRLTATQDKIIIDIVAFGDDIEREQLQSFVSQMPAPSHFIWCPVGGPILGDAIFGSEIGPGIDAGRRLLATENGDPELAITIQMSIADARRDDDDELQAAIRASREDGLCADEVDLMTAIQASIDDQPKSAAEETENEGKKSDEEK